MRRSRLEKEKRLEEMESRFQGRLKEEFATSTETEDGASDSPETLKRKLVERYEYVREPVFQMSVQRP